MVLELLQYASIVLELAIAVLGVMMIVSKKNSIGWFFLVTFGIYVFYDLVRLRGMVISSGLLYASFFIATLSALVIAWRNYSGK